MYILTIALYRTILVTSYHRNGALDGEGGVPCVACRI